MTTPRTSRRTRAALAALGLTAASLGAAACSSSGSGTGTGIIDNSGSSPADCATLATKFAAAVTGFGTSSSPDIGILFQQLAKSLPNDLQDDAKVLASTFTKFATVLQKEDGDMAKALADPDGRAAIIAMGSEKAAAANAAIEHYFATACPQK